MLSERDKFWYLFVYLIAGAVAYELLLVVAPGTPPNLWDRIDVIANLLIFMMGTYWAYRANGAEKGTDFLGRFFSLGVVVMIRFCVGLVPLFALLAGYYMFMPLDKVPTATAAMDVIPFLLWYVLFYVRLVIHIRDLRP
ncbi:hypothetical protein OH456_06650 [Vibrio sp. La 4.2.2]|uniref:hypothetical protein n=1 Tax=Vibrio sp. La 4.2.2 TaxID=2998830 RepID=UPI0022CE0BBA|nr:hypothetical protein [Vibrio sp. La 4.2.2]MDA0107814.1 hypothetical protein [Vibrio sp. La 4.2.2]